MDADAEIATEENFMYNEEEITKEKYEQGVNEITSLQVIDTQSEYNPKDILKYADLIH